jgi:CheY-like chemotaxis protein
MPPPVAANTAHSHSVLIVDDYAGTRESLAQLLQMERFEIAVAASGHEALDMLQAGLRPCVVLLDLRMPGMDGWEVFDRMQAHAELRATPVIILSGEPADNERARRVGVREFLEKPAAKSAIVAAVERHCERRG